MTLKVFTRGTLLAAALPLVTSAAGSPAPTPARPASRCSMATVTSCAGDALRKLERLTQESPGYGLGRLMYGELRAVLAQAAPVSAAAAPADARMIELAEEARLRLLSEQAVPPAGAVPANVLRLSSAHRHVIVVDLPRAHLYLLENTNGDLRVVRHHYAAIGKNGFGKEAKGDLRTPVGVYHITGWIDDRKLPELYGAGAFPVSYPNPWDVFKRRTGSGIWLHGVPRDTPAGSRPPRSSEGCVTMANDDLLALKPYLKLGSTPVIFSDNVEWLQPAQSQSESGAWLNRVEEWRARWSARDTEAYLEFYAHDFTTAGMNRAKFVEHKRRVNGQKKFIEINLTDLDLYRYPGAGEPLVLVEFTMDYRSDNYSSKVQKQQFWRQEPGGEWRIFREENR
jgi:murein L,D-transpeptidase YafK